MCENQASLTAGDVTAASRTRNPSRPSIVIAMDSFKGCVSSLEAGEAVAAGILSVLPDARVRRLPVADGGEGTIEAIAQGVGGERLAASVTAPDGTPVRAQYLVLHGDTALIELASASGLTLVPEACRNPMTASTFGTGELIRDALDRGFRKILLAVGGSATNDGGIGIMNALGARFLDAGGKPVPGSGGSLDAIERIDLSGLHRGVTGLSLLVACDVTNPLCGETGASRVFGPQKGATPEMVDALDEGLRSYAGKIREWTGLEVADMPGCGAAGGVNASLVAFCGAVLMPGISWVLEAIGLRNSLSDADLVITGEGRMDGQSIFGKAPIGVASIAKERNLPVVAIVGDTGPGAEAVLSHGIDRILRLRQDGMSVEESMKRAAGLLFEAGVTVAREVRFDKPSTNP